MNLTHEQKMHRAWLLMGGAFRPSKVVNVLTDRKQRCLWSSVKHNQIRGIEFTNEMRTDKWIQENDLWFEISPVNLAAVLKCFCLVVFRSLPAVRLSSRVGLPSWVTLLIWRLDYLNGIVRSISAAKTHTGLFKILIFVGCGPTMWK